MRFHRDEDFFSSAPHETFPSLTTRPFACLHPEDVCLHQINLINPCEALENPQASDMNIYDDVSL